MPPDPKRGSRFTFKQVFDTLALKFKIHLAENFLQGHEFKLNL
jgi:hypothetical protein